MDVAQESKRMFDAGDYQWKHAFSFDLHQRNPRLTAQWAILCAERLIAFRFPARRSELKADFDAARLHLDALPDPEDPEKVELEIWYRPNRDAPQTAMSKLFTAIRELHQKSNCVWASGAVIGNLVADDWGTIPEACSSTELYEIVLECYLDILHGKQSDHDPTIAG